MSPDRETERPAGFVWQSLDGINGKVLKPDFWFFQTLVGTGIPTPVTYHLSRENIFRTPLKTGLTIIKGVFASKFKNVNDEVIDEVAREFKGILEDSQDAPSTPTLGFITRDLTGIITHVSKIHPLVAPPEPGELHYRIQVSLVTGTGYVIYFESGLKTNKKDREIRDKMLESIRLDPDI